MIVWLASYPRSGNTLLRTVLHQTLGHSSYSDEIDPEVRRNVALAEGVERKFGHFDLPSAWDDFYPHATRAGETYFVKTHRAPRDNQPAIYVIRDGRSALVSYAKFHREFQPQHGKSLPHLVLGDDYYGGWSDHYRAWSSRGGAQTLVLRYEDLARASDSLVESLARFIGTSAPPRPWVNPFEEMRNANPAFFRRGKLEWDGDAAWTPFVDRLFWRLHGELMRDLGYPTPPGASSDADETAFIDIAAALLGENRELRRVCGEREHVIETLNRACEERLALIEKLNAR